MLILSLCCCAAFAMFQCFCSFLWNLPFKKGKICAMVTWSWYYCLLPDLKQPFSICLLSDMQQQFLPLHIMMCLSVQISLNFDFWKFSFFIKYISQFICNSFSFTTKGVMDTSHPFLHHIIVSYVHVYLHKKWISPPLCWRLWNFCACHGDWKIYDTLVHNTLFLTAISNLCFVWFNTG